MVHPGWDDVAGRMWWLDDLLTGNRYERDGDDVAANGLYRRARAWESHLFAWTPIAEAA